MKGSSSITECLFFCNKLDLKSAQILKIQFFKKKNYTIWQNQIKNRLDAIKSVIIKDIFGVFAKHCANQ